MTWGLEDLTLFYCFMTKLKTLDDFKGYIRNKENIKGLPYTIQWHMVYMVKWATLS